MSHPFVLLRNLDDLAAYPHQASPERIGGKAARLVWLIQNGFDVPGGWVLESTLFRERMTRCLPSGLDPKSLLERMRHADGVEILAETRERILARPIDPKLFDELAAAWEQMAPRAPWGLAVRSSATCEDDEVMAMAGLASTVLGVCGADALADAVREVWASALLPRALAYLASRGATDIAMAVILQRLVPAKASGVMFTRPPAGMVQPNWAQDERLINATLGLGAPVANGAVSPDMIRLAAGSGEVRAMTIADKSYAMVAGLGAMQHVDVPPDRANQPALSPPVLSSLASIADRMESIEDCAHDIEFVVEQDRVFVVQARPVTGAGYPEGGDADTVWSRANVGEALPGAATPLTWSVAQRFSERGFRQAFGSLGCVVPNDLTLVANVHGRFYLNLTAFMRIAAQVPGLEPRTLTHLGGGNGTNLLEEQVKGVSRRRFYARLPITAVRVTAEQLTLSSRVDRFTKRMNHRWPRLQAQPLGSLSNRSLSQVLVDALDMLDETGRLMLACGAASLAAHLVLRRYLGWVTDEDPEHLSQVLTAGIAALESARPGVVVDHIAELARRDPDIAAALSAGRFQNLSDVPPGPVHDAFVAFLKDFGDRALREAELASPRWRENPAAVFSMVASAVHKSDADQGSVPSRGRQAAEQELGRLRHSLHSVQFHPLRQLVVHAQRTTRLREQTRAWVTRVLGEIRRIALEIDRRLLCADPSLQHNAVFFCTVDELLHALRTDRWDACHLVKLREAEYRRDKSRPDPPVTFVGLPPPVVVPPAGEHTLRGLPASSGVVEGKVRVLEPGHELEHGLLPGEVLVARTTDVGLTPLFLVAAGIVTELGGPLSHAAIVAREYGVPAVVNVPGATVVLRSGDRVRIDGTHGTVERLEVQT